MHARRGRRFPSCPGHGRRRRHRLHHLPGAGAGRLPGRGVGRGCRRARRVADELGAPHDARAFDVSDEASVMAAFDDIETRHGPISVLVSAAGLLLFQDNGERPLIKDTTLDIWERSFAVNARGVFLCGREFLRRREAAPVPRTAASSPSARWPRSWAATAPALRTSPPSPPCWA
ncbi:SDR family oxidoreductase [Achromobacter xylosoxidans]